MTTEGEVPQHRPRAITVLLFGGILALSAGFLSCASHAALDANTLPRDMRPSYEVFANRCSKCHSLARPLNAQVETMEHWERYVARMRRMPGSGINRRSAEEVLHFLHYYTTVIRGEGERDPNYEPQVPDDPGAPLPEVGSDPEPEPLTEPEPQVEPEPQAEPEPENEQEPSQAPAGGTHE